MPYKFFSNSKKAWQAMYKANPVFCEGVCRVRGRRSFDPFSAQKGDFKQNARLAGGAFSGQQEAEAENNL